MPEEQKFTDEAGTIVGEGKHITTQTITIAGREIVLEEFCNYKILEAATALAGLMEDLGLDEVLEDWAGLDETADATELASKFWQIVPRIMRESPEPLLYIAALCLIPNAKLKELYGQEPGAIAKAIEQELAWLKFEVTTPDVIDLLEAYLPYMGLEALKNRLGPIVGRLFGGKLPGMTAG